MRHTWLGLVAAAVGTVLMAAPAMAGGRGGHDGHHRPSHSSSSFRLSIGVGSAGYGWSANRFRFSYSSGGYYGGGHYYGASYYHSPVRYGRPIYVAPYVSPAPVYVSPAPVYQYQYRPVYVSPQYCAPRAPVYHYGRSWGHGGWGYSHHR